jgi:hypothetical protein
MRLWAGYVEDRAEYLKARWHHVIVKVDHQFLKAAGLYVAW